VSLPVDPQTPDCTRVRQIDRGRWWSYLEIVRSTNRPMTDDEIRDIFAELRRVGVDLGQPPGLALGTGFREGELLAWLRGLPENMGHGGFVEALDTFITAATPNVVLEDGEPVPIPPRRYSPTIEQVHAAIDILLREWDPLGARLGELTRDDVAIPAYNALTAILQSGPTRHVEAMIAASLHQTEREVFGVRPGPLIQTRYLVRQIMQAVGEHPGPPHEFNPLELLGQETGEGYGADAAAPGGRSRSSGRQTVALGPRGDEPIDTFDPDAACSECGAIGTVAWVTREIDPKLSRYCLTCWRQVRHRYHGIPEFPQDRDSPEFLIAIVDHMYEYKRELWRSSDSALWEDKATFIRMGFARHRDESESDHERRLRRFATEVASLATRMYDPMPSDIGALVQRYAAADA
jgi:hypothetical protein